MRRWLAGLLCGGPDVLAVVPAWKQNAGRPSSANPVTDRSRFRQPQNQFQQPARIARRLVSASVAPVGHNRRLVNRSDEADDPV